MVVLQKLVADIAFVHTVCGVSFFVSQRGDLAQGIELDKPSWLLVELIPQASLGVLDCHFMQCVLYAFFVEGYPGALGKGAEPAAQRITC